MSIMRLTSQADLSFLYDVVKMRLSGSGKWEEVTRGHSQSREIFLQHCAKNNLPSIGFECNGKPIGGMVYDGVEVHIEVLPKYHSRWAVLWPSAMKWLFSIKDPMLVSVERSNEKCHQFILRNNWHVVKETDKVLTYEISSRSNPIYQRLFGDKKPDAVLVAASSVTGNVD